MLSCLIEKIVKAQVELGGFFFGNAACHTPGEGGDNALHGIPVAGSAVLTGILHSHYFQSVAEAEDFIQVPARQFGHHSRPAVLHYNQALAFQAAKRVADGPWADFHSFGQPRGLQLFTGR